jgi:hypothetical protein
MTLEIERSRCWTKRDIDLAALRHPPPDGDETVGTNQMRVA